jgi:threonine synthase
MWISTRGQSPAVSFREALLNGIAPDGGLYIPERIEPLPANVLESFGDASLPEVGAAIAAPFVGDDLSPLVLGRLIADALDFPVPLVEVSPTLSRPVSTGRPRSGVYALELFHGPTLAFKDVGARVMARLMAHLTTDPFTVLVATSGDTGSAVAQAFAGLDAARVVVLFPEGQVSDVQEAQFATIGGNVLAVAVAGTFDDCQALVKQAFADVALGRDVRLTSANSINVGRLLPQVFYYVWAAAQVSRLDKGFSGLVMSVPSGNFGNLTAGLIAKRLGVPIGRFIAATNVNDVVPEYLATGRYAPRPSMRTVANAMDVGSPSNFERIRALYGDSVDLLRQDLIGAAYGDAAVAAAIRDVHAAAGYLLDPHSAIAWMGLRDHAPGGGVFLATAHPAKFREIVEPAIGAAVLLPAPLADALRRPRVVTRISTRYDELVALLHT